MAKREDERETVVQWLDDLAAAIRAGMLVQRTAEMDQKALTGSRWFDGRVMHEDPSGLMDVVVKMRLRNPDG
jgi:hypothetical protein